MGEVLRFRIARAPQRVPTLPSSRLTLSTGADVAALLSAANRASYAKAYLAGKGLAPPARQFVADAFGPVLPATLGEVRRTDQFLSAHDNRVEPQALKSELTTIPGVYDFATARSGWQPLRNALSDALAISMAGHAEPELRADLTRLLLVIGLIELLADAPSPVATPNHVFAALRWRDVVVPPDVFAHRSYLARRPGVSDLYVVREEWNRYELGEIAHIESVLAGEAKRRTHEVLTEVEATVVQERETSAFTEHDTQTADRFELQEESSRDASLAFHVEGKVDTSGQYGPTHIDTHVGGSFDYSVKEAERRATKQASETVARAVSRVEQKVREQRTTRTLTRVREQNEHTLDNSGKAEHVVGIYRWVDKIQTVQLFRYPDRTLFEFEIPEPGSFVRWSRGRSPRAGTVPNPDPLTDTGSESGTRLTADMLGWASEPGKVDYLTLARRYLVNGLQPPPEDKVIFAELKHPAPNKDFNDKNLPPEYAPAVSVDVPDGWEAHDFRVFMHSTNAAPESPEVPGHPIPPTGWVDIIVGTDFPTAKPNTDDAGTLWRFQGLNVRREMLANSFRKPVSGKVPIQLATDDTRGLYGTVELRCRPTQRAVMKWRLETYEAVQRAYAAMKSRYDEDVASRSVRTMFSIDGDSPARNAEVVREELKKFVVEMLSGDRFTGRPAVDDAAGNLPPMVRLEDAAAVAAEIQFVEQVFEWENMTYVLYPYFWAPVTSWADLANISSPDALFDRFLRAGSARVIVPARPGFESHANLYTVSGLVWGGGPVPIPGDDVYLSVAEEIRAQQQPITDGEPGDYWEVRLPTTLTYLEKVGTAVPLKNAGARLPVVQTPAQ